MNKHSNGIQPSFSNGAAAKMADLDPVNMLSKRVNEITHYIRNDIHECRLIIKNLHEKNQELASELKKRTEFDENNLGKLKEAEMLAHGKHQLIEKLLDDINRCHNELEWYKRTYEKRTFIGLLKQRLFNGWNKR